MNNLPKIGLILLRAEWFDSVVALPELAEVVQLDAGAMAKHLGEQLEVAAVWVVNSTESLQRTCAEIKTSDADLFVLSFQVWAEDFYLRPLLDALGGRPLAVWCYQPWGRLPEKLSFIDVLRASGPVGTFEGLGTLRNLGASFTFTQGTADDGRVLHDLSLAGRAARVRRLLRSARFGLLPARNPQMQSTFVDEFRLLHELGPIVEYLSIGDLQRLAEGVPEQEVRAYVQDLRSRYPVRGVSAETLALAARASLGVAHLAAEQHLDVLSFNEISPELHDTFGLRPCLYPPLYDQAGVHVGLEGDLGAATALFILQRLTGSPVFFVEMWAWDEAENVVLGGHAGPQDPAVALPEQVWISHDFEFAQSDRTEGAHLLFIARPGRVTLLQLRCTPDGWQAIVAAGQSLGGEPRLEGYPHAVIRLDAPIDRFVRQVAKVGSTQHWIMAYGDVMDEVRLLCELAPISLELIR